MTGTSSQQSYEFTAGWGTSALQPIPTNIIARNHSSNFVSALVLDIQTKKKCILRLIHSQPLQDAKIRSSRCERPSLSWMSKLPRYCLADACLVENIGEVVIVCLDVWCCFFLLCFTWFYLSSRINHSCEGKVPFKLSPLSKIGAWGGPRDRRDCVQKKMGKIPPMTHKLQNSQWVTNTFNHGCNRINPPQVLAFVPTATRSYQGQTILVSLQTAGMRAPSK